MSSFLSFLKKVDIKKQPFLFPSSLWEEEGGEIRLFPTTPNSALNGHRSYRQQELFPIPTGGSGCAYVGVGGAAAGS